MRKFLLAIVVLALLPGGFVLSRAKARQGPATTVAGPDITKTLAMESSASPTRAPDFRLQDLDGKPVRLGELKGNVVLLNFWASWCPPCRMEMPDMEQLHRQLGPDGLVILAVNYREGPAEIRAFLDEQELSFTALPDPRGEVFAAYQAWSLPTTYLINKRGEILGKAVGYRDWDSDLAKGFFVKLLREGAGPS
jgi:peroxiredoxin